MGLDWIGFGYAALVASGGIIGYVKAGSVPSLAAGLLFGSLAGLGAYQLSQNPKNVWLSLSFPFTGEHHTVSLFMMVNLAAASTGQFIPLVPMQVQLPFSPSCIENPIASGTLAGVMGMRFYNSRKVMPAGLIAGASLLMVGRLGLKMIEKPHDA